MRKPIKRGLVVLLAAVLALSCCGCTKLKVIAEPEDLYTLPRLPDEYTGLENSINDILGDGGEYSAPTSGTNIQPVQLVDLDGDGQEEALAFIRKSADERQQKIYIFSAVDNSYEQYAVIEGSAASISTVEYLDLNQDGRLELVVGWRVSTELQALSVYAVDGVNQPVELLRTVYVKYAAADLNGDGNQEIVALHTDTQGNSVADYYGWRSGELVFLSSAKLSMTMAELSRIEEGKLTDGSSALFVCGVDDSSVAILDILNVRDTELTNITLSAVTGVSSEIFHYLSIYPTDINNDGVTEVPIPATSTTQDETSTQSSYRINWRAYDTNGRGETVEITYHDLADGWYLVLPDTWLGRISVTRWQSATNEITVTFSINERDGTKTDFLNIYTITGSGREYRVRGNRFVLRRQTETIFAAELLTANEEWQYGMTQDELRSSFNLITTEWLPEIT